MIIELNIGTVTNDKKHRYSTVDLAHSLNVILERQHANVTWKVAIGNGDWGEEITIDVQLKRTKGRSDGSLCYAPSGCYSVVQS